ncbi:MAG: tRNA (adenosine(37)-N6)-threonylcarbamoyltransferase complex dimerization subunit type 1 TsaB [Clostridiales bacterium]|nr:tRNA (adenosine(37)-N6)-threonylcarbamoyltransferase complex dimerization subunit type 1 TsaB [Clostridiales bacterium]
MRLVLAISTSCADASVALVMPSSIVASRKLGGTSHSKTLMPVIDEMLEEFSISISDIDGIAVDIGPGSFTGVRIGVATANGLAFGASKPVIGINSLLALRANVPKIDVVASIIDAKHDNIYAAIYEKDSELLPPYSTTIDEFIAHIPSNCLCVGDGAIIYKDRIHFANPYVKIISKDNTEIFCANNNPCAVSVGFAALALYFRDNSCAVSQVEPSYYKPSQAEMKRDAKAEVEDSKESCEFEDAD